MVDLRALVVRPMGPRALDVVVAKMVPLAVEVTMALLVVLIALVVVVVVVPERVVVCPGRGPGFLLVVVNMLVCTVDEKSAVAGDDC